MPLLQHLKDYLMFVNFDSQNVHLLYGLIVFVSFFVVGIWGTI